MLELVRDTVFGHFLRVLSHGNLLPYAENKDPSLWQRYVHSEKSAQMAEHGRLFEDEEKEADKEAETEAGVPPALQHHGEGGQLPSRRSSETPTEEGQERNFGSGAIVDPEKGKDVNVIEWFGDDDPENPYNWSSPKKVLITAELCLLTFSVYIGSAIFSAGEMTVVEQFGVGEVPAILGLTLFVAGYGLGPMIWAPMSEIPQIGRNPVYIGTLVIFVFFQFAVIYAKNFGMLLAFRFLTGFFGSPVLATGGASLADIYRPTQRAYAIAIWGAAAVCGPVLGPLIGGFAAEAKGWTWTIWELMWLSGASLILFIFFLPETSAANILYRRSRRLRRLTKNENLKCEAEILSEEMTLKDVAVMVMIRPFVMNFTEPICFFLNLYIALIYALLYCWFESFVIVFMEMHGFSLGIEGLAYIGILLGALIVIPPFFLYLKLVQEKQFNENGELKPEKRLPPAFVGAFCIPICLFGFGWTSRPDIPWIAPIIMSSFFTIGAFLLFNSVLNYLGDAYPAYAASVLAGNDFMRSGFGAGFPLFAGAMYRNLGVGWASSLLGFLSVAFIPIPFLLYKYGERIRHKSKRARHDL